MNLRERYGSQLREFGAGLRALLSMPMLGAAIAVILVTLVPLWDKSFDPAEILIWLVALGAIAGLVAAPIAFARQKKFEDEMPSNA